MLSDYLARYLCLVYSASLPIYATVIEGSPKEKLFEATATLDESLLMYNSRNKTNSIVHAIYNRKKKPLNASIIRHEKHKKITDTQDKRQQGLPNCHSCPPEPKQLAHSKSPI
jgi:hypothetical protein